MTKDLIGCLKEINKGICKICGSSIGSIKKNDYFCYQCKGFSIVNDLEKKKNQLKKLRTKFRKILLKSDPFYILTRFIAYGELVWIDGVIPDDIKSTKIIRNNHPTFTIQDEKFISQNIRYLVISNVGIRWILEDVNYGTFKRIPPKLDQLSKLADIVGDWIKLFQEIKMVENGLGHYIKKDGIEDFFVFQSFKFYNETLEEFGLVGDNTRNIQKNKSFDKFIEKMQPLENDPKKLKKHLKTLYPLKLISSMYSFLPDDQDRPFSFEDMMGFGLHKIIDIIATIYLQNNEFVNVVDYNDLNRLFPNFTWYSKLFNILLISDRYNPMSFPLIIRFGNKYIISPKRLRCATLMLGECEKHQQVHREKHLRFSSLFQDKVKKLLINNNVDIIAENWQDKKNASFEEDLLGIYKGYILVIECKSFYPSPFVAYRKNRRYQDQFRKTLDKMDQVKDWIYGQIMNRPTKKISIYSKVKGKEWIKIPDKIKKIQKDKIIYLYITQIKEYHICHRDDIIQVWYGDL